jgi:hypothetical protein
MLWNASFQQLLLRIAKANKILKQRTGDIDATIDRHNAFVMLTFCVVSIGTCHRPTHGTVPDLGSIDSSTGLFSTVDKGPSSARLAVCADAAVAQCQGWLTYRNNFDFEKHFGANPNSGLFFIDANHEVRRGKRQLSERSVLPVCSQFRPAFGKDGS